MQSTENTQTEKVSSSQSDQKEQNGFENEQDAR